MNQALVNGGATCAVTYQSTGTHSITAQYGGDQNFTGSASRAGQVGVVPAPGKALGVQVLGTITATMQWSFSYTPAYTKVLSLILNGVPPGATIVVGCHGRGCPFVNRADAVSSATRCGLKRRHRCRPVGTLDLTSAFHRHRLRVGARITVVITRPGWIGKYYMFKVRSRRGPGIRITCLAPGETRPGVGC
jgi:hypothetical protein